MTSLLSPSIRFWQYHLSGCTLVIIVYMIMHYLHGSDLIVLTLSNIVGMLFLTISVLFFRYVYKLQKWENKAAHEIVVLIFIYSVLVGCGIAVLLMMLTKPWILEPRLVAANEDLHWQIHKKLFLMLSFTYQIISCGWGFIYSYVIANRISHEKQLYNLQLQDKFKEAKLIGLTSQLNPHFLFNTLNNLRFVMYESHNKADKMITDLSDLLRYSLTHSQKEKVKLADELSIIDTYLSIQKLHLESRLQFTADIKINTNNVFIPPMSLQNLIENSIKHGIELLPRGGNLLLKIDEQNNQFRFFISNDKPLQKPTVDTNTKGVGLNNIQQRLLLLYGDDAQFSYIDLNETFNVTMMIPKEK